ncbi:L-threonylcarbamoyladenylate synthase [Glycomyces algeriensis]|uniref:L-threonylcarbamoyladenylate synthase n=1 Tax=Glycomyces algeriensis TaxID=256037 RepID=A0A9W6LJC9_9ACTN|nr:L-threonylcarbamoyladenylate synthase [Glycomyces algeriensis]MDA1366516.1 L-threonylcarbamoyladenylate synthase [Glycomyces algeriensis]MDR7352174.1 tRNA threonylcarbamoyl adenosine modification protein (Sua5/YciO/YrdC/YwlC family) [Glycomyces algeriensis]GLI44909.1 threonylcarbamoyl-AMP synthase [Glycomyces algeriensis]
MRLFNCRKIKDRATGLKSATRAVTGGRLVVIPTDTVYGIGCDAFNPTAVKALLAAKGRGRDMAPPVLIGSKRALDGIASDIPDSAKELIEAFWPGPLTIVVPYTPSLTWDLGDTDGTVAVRMPLHPLALELLKETGPMAVSSANKTGQPPADTAADAKAQLGSDVSVYLEAGPITEPIYDFASSVVVDNQPSTIIDCVAHPPQILRLGALSLEQIRKIVPDTLDRDGYGPGQGPEDDEPEADDTEAAEAEADETAEPKADEASA